MTDPVTPMVPSEPEKPPLLRERIAELERVQKLQGQKVDALIKAMDNVFAELNKMRPALHQVCQMLNQQAHTALKADIERTRNDGKGGIVLP